MDYPVVDAIDPVDLDILQVRVRSPILPYA